MKPLTLNDLDAALRRDPAYLDAERQLKPALDLANDIIARRVEAGFSQTELAARAGTDQANISRLESALANPTLKFLQKLAAALDAELEIRLRPAAPATDTPVRPFYAAQTPAPSAWHAVAHAVAEEPPAYTASAGPDQDAA